MTDAYTKKQLRILAAEYIMLAVEIESEEARAYPIRVESGGFPKVGG
jgi:hypothetical protein